MHFENQRGNREFIEKKHYILTLQQFRCAGVIPTWDATWNKQVEAAKKSPKPKKLSILPTILGAFGASYFLSSVLYFALILLQFASPQIVNLLIDFVETDEPTWRGYFYTFLIAASTISVSVLNSQSFYQVGYVQSQLRDWMKLISSYSCD